MKTILVFYPNYGAGVGSCLISFSVLLEVAKYLKIDFAIDWSQRAQLKNKDVCIFNDFFEYPKHCNETKIIYGNNIHQNITKKGTLIKPPQVFDIETNNKIYIIRDSCSENLILNRIKNFDISIKKNLQQLIFKFNDDKSHILKKFDKFNFCSTHIRTGNSEFTQTTAFWKRDSIIKKYFKFILTYKLKKYLIKKDKSYLNFENRLIFTDSYNLTSYFKKNGFKSIQNKHLNEEIHYKNFFEKTEDGLSFYEQSLFEIKVISKSNLIIWDGSGFAKAAILLSKSANDIRLNEILGIFLIIDYIYRFMSIIRRLFTRRSLLNITK